MLCLTTLTSKSPWFVFIWAASPPAPLGRPGWSPMAASRVQVLPLHVNYLPAGCLLQAMVSFPECFPTSLPWARPACSCTKCPGEQITCGFHKLLQSSSTWRGWFNIFLCCYRCEANVLKSAADIIFPLNCKKRNLICERKTETGYLLFSVGKWWMEKALWAAGISAWILF